MGLFNLIKQHDRPGAAAHLLGELPAVLITHIARRRADQTADRVLFHIFGHIQTDQRLLVAVYRGGQRAAELGLPDACRTEEQKTANRALRILQTDTAAADRAGEQRDGLVLADDALPEPHLEIDQLFTLTAVEGVERDIGPL